MERRESEAQAQAAVFDWARWEQSQTPVLKAMYHAANEGKRSVRAGADLKRQGMKPGVSDICLPYAAGGFNNLYIELKVGSNKATEEQLTFIDTINRIGGKAVADVDTSELKQPIICVFNRPDDYPDKCVARLFEGTAPTNIIITRNTVEEIREDITNRFPAMLPFARSKEDHKSVVESWI